MLMPDYNLTIINKDAQPTYTQTTWGCDTIERLCYFQIVAFTELFEGDTDGDELFEDLAAFFSIQGGARMEFATNTARNRGLAQSAEDVDCVQGRRRLGAGTAGAGSFNLLNELDEKSFSSSAFTNNHLLLSSLAVLGAAAFLYL
jgi:hypothetical protein